MISIILPYWMRQEAADKALLSLERLYAGIDFEVVIVDDGSEVPFVNPCTALDVRVYTLPKKRIAKSPLAGWNLGVEKARGEIVILSCVEVIHEAPVIEQLAAHVRQVGPKGYVLASAWCPEEGVYHCHSTVQPPYNAPGTGIGFCAALHKSLYVEAGGFDPDYRDGAGYEDCDWINRLLRAGAIFVHRDDLRVIHPKTGATIAWGGERFERNFALFRKKWPESPANRIINFVCVNAGNYCGRGAEYVNVLFDMVQRNMPPIPFRFHCLTDDAQGLDPRTKVIELPADLDGWWGKLYLFKPGLFADGERMIFLDLDTAIVGSLEGLIGYDGDLATLRDFSGVGMGPAAIFWKAGKGARYWTEWEAAGKPRNFHGDKGWIEHLGWDGDILQDVFPAAFKSFKYDCQPMFPEGTKVVCFHGEPRPHNATEDWVRACWKVGGGTAAELSALCNVHHERIAANVRSSMARGLPLLDFWPARDGQAVIVGGGPSLKDTLGELRWRAGLGQVIFATNGAGKFLRANGIEPDHVVILDARPENAAFVLPGAHHFLASHCAPELFEGTDATIYHANTAGVDEGLGGGDHVLISTGSTVGLVAIGIAHVLGFRTFHLYGMDSSYRAEHHAYPQALNDGDAVIECVAAGETFKAAPWMLLQAQQFQSLAVQLANEGCVLTAAGDGLLPHIARELGKQYQEAA